MDIFIVNALTKQNVNPDAETDSGVVHSVSEEQHIFAFGLFSFKSRSATMNANDWDLHPYPILFGPLMIRPLSRC